MFGIMSGKYRWSREKFGLIVDFCFSLPNFHIRLHPLWEKDGEYYQSVMADLKRRKEVMKDRVKKRQQKHRARQARMKAAMEELEDKKVGFGEVTAEVSDYLENEDGKKLVCIFILSHLNTNTYVLFNRVISGSTGGY